MEYPKFHEKLRLDNLYPSLPQKKIKGHPLFEEFKRNLPLGYDESPYPGQMIHTPNLDPSTKPMDVVFNPGISETARAMGAARTINNVDLSPGAMSAYQGGQLNLRNQEMMQRAVLAGGKLENDRSKTSIADFKARNPGHKFIQGEDGKLRAVHPLTKEVTDLGITGMSQQEIADMNQSNAIQKIDRSGEMSRELEALKQTHRVINQDDAQLAAGGLQDDKQNSEADIKRNTPILPSQERIARLSRAEEARNSNPAWAPYIKIVPGGGFVIKSPGRFTGPDQATYDAINTFINSAPKPIRTVETSTVTHPEIKINPDAAKVTPKSKYQVTVR